MRNGVFLTFYQLMCAAEKKKCFRCEKEAKWHPQYEGPSYCDEHYPYWEYYRDFSSYRYIQRDSAPTDIFKEKDDNDNE